MYLETLRKNVILFKKLLRKTAFLHMIAELSDMMSLASVVTEQLEWASPNQHVLRVRAQQIPKTYYKNECKNNDFSVVTC